MTVGSSILVVAGETSGDMHGEALVAELKKRRPSLSFFGIGGDQMQKAGVQLIRHSKEMAFLGFFEVIRHFPFIRRVFKEMTGFLDSKKPDLVILIDYPGFNLRFAREVKKRGIPIFYYISPQVWAWGKGRVLKMAKWIDRIAVIFPFEEVIYRSVGMQVRYVGHPLIDRVKSSQSKTDFFQGLRLKPDRPTIGLLPGSRRQEVQILLPEMVQACMKLLKDIPELQAVLGMAPTLSPSDYQMPAVEPGWIRTVRDQTYEVMKHSDAVMVASGTATLETAILGTPMVILYKMSHLSYLLGKTMVKIKNIGLANIVAGKTVVPELIQKEANAGRIAEAVRPLLMDKATNEAIRRELAVVSERLGEGGASARTAEWVLDMMDSKTNASLG